jgi:transposase-like protein
MDAAALVISDEDRATLQSWVRSRSIRASHVERARIVLAVAGGKGTSGTAREVGVSRPTVIKWRDRFVEHGIAGLADEPRSGRPKTVDDSVIIAATLEPPPRSLAVTHWSSRLLARQLGVGDATVARTWRKYRRAVPEPADQRGRAVRGREVPDPGAEPDRADAAAARRAAGEGDPRLPA